MQSVYTAIVYHESDFMNLLNYLNCISRCKVVIYINIIIHKFSEMFSLNHWFVVTGTHSFYTLKMKNVSIYEKRALKWILCFLMLRFRGLKTYTAFFFFFVLLKFSVSTYLYVWNVLQHEIMLKQVSVIV